MGQWSGAWVSEGRDNGVEHGLVRRWGNGVEHGLVRRWGNGVEHGLVRRGTMEWSMG